MNIKIAIILYLVIAIILIVISIIELNISAFSGWVSSLLFLKSLTNKSNN